MREDPRRIPREIEALDREGIIQHSTGLDVADEYFLNRYPSIKEDDFIGQPYRDQTITPEDVAKDRQRIEKIKRSPNYVKEKGPAAVSAEYVLMDGIVDKHWLGNEITAIKTSEFDDFCRQTDLVLKINDSDASGQFRYIGIDVTTLDKDAPRLEEKRRRSLKNLQGQEEGYGLINLKYFENQEPLPVLVVDWPLEITTRLRDELCGFTKHRGSKGEPLGAVILVEAVMNQIKEQVLTISDINNQNDMKKIESAEDLMKMIDQLINDPTGLIDHHRKGQELVKFLTTFQQTLPYLQSAAVQNYNRLLSLQGKERGEQAYSQFAAINGWVRQMATAE